MTITMVDARAHLFTGAGAVALICAVGGAAGAQTVAVNGPYSATAAPPPAVAAKGSTANAPAAVEEIVVTAQRRQENLQRVPVTVTAITAGAISRANIESTTSLQQVTPGLTWSVANRSSLPYIRGIGTADGSIGNESSVAMYVDGVYIDNSVASTLELNNIERVEVLKGPQGTLFGRNATGGLIQIITKQPSQTASGGPGARLRQLLDLSRHGLRHRSDHQQPLRRPRFRGQRTERGLGS